MKLKEQDIDDIVWAIDTSLDKLSGWRSDTEAQQGDKEEFGRLEQRLVKLREKFRGEEPKQQEAWGLGGGPKGLIAGRRYRINFIPAGARKVRTCVAQYLYEKDGNIYFSHRPLAGTGWIDYRQLIGDPVETTDPLELPRQVR